jgi:hypothetical protein
MNTKSKIIIDNLSQKFNNLQIVPLKKNKVYNVDSLILSMNKIKIGKKILVKNNVINNIYTKYDLFSLLNKKLFMDEKFGPILVRYFTGSIRTLKMIPEETNYDDNSSSIIEIID